MNYFTADNCHCVIIMVNRGLVFIGLMFLGMGIGMFFDRAGEGTIIGMGAGFVALAFLPKHEDSVREGSGIANIRRRLHTSFLGTTILVLIGLGFIIGGLYMLGIIQIPRTICIYLGGVFLLLLGVSFLFLAFKKRIR